MTDSLWLPLTVCVKFALLACVSSPCTEMDRLPFETVRLSSPSLTVRDRLFFTVMVLSWFTVRVASLVTVTVWSCFTVRVSSFSTSTSMSFWAWAYHSSLSSLSSNRISLDLPVPFFVLWLLTVLLDCLSGRV